MTEQTAQITKTAKQPKQANDKPPIGRMTLAEVDIALADCEKVISTHTALVKLKLNSNASISSNILRELSRANVQRGRLVMRRISQLVELGEPAAQDLIDKLLKVQPTVS